MELISLWFFVMHYATSGEAKKLKGLSRDKTDKISHFELLVHLIFLYMYGLESPGYIESTQQNTPPDSKIIQRIGNWYGKRGEGRESCE